jgi:hypothetical protein
VISKRSWNKNPIAVRNPARIPEHQSVAPVAQVGDERRLLQLGLALAIVYVVFLGLWFWGTREGRRRVESATRF